MGEGGGRGGEKLGIKLKLSFSWGLGLAELGKKEMGKKIDPGRARLGKKIDQLVVYTSLLIIQDKAECGKGTGLHWGGHHIGNMYAGDGWTPHILSSKIVGFHPA